MGGENENLNLIDPEDGVKVGVGSTSSRRRRETHDASSEEWWKEGEIRRWPKPTAG